MGKGFDMIYENPSSLLDASAWTEWRDQMHAEMLAHPDWREPKEAYQMAVDHLAWIAREVRHFVVPKQAA
jgi:hypothetical protein